MNFIHYDRYEDREIAVCLAGVLPTGTQVDTETLEKGRVRSVDDCPLPGVRNGEFVTQVGELHCHVDTVAALHLEGQVMLEHAERFVPQFEAIATDVPHQRNVALKPVLLEVVLDELGEGGVDELFVLSRLHDALNLLECFTHQGFGTRIGRFFKRNHAFPLSELVVIHHRVHDSRMQSINILYQIRQIMSSMLLNTLYWPAVLYLSSVSFF